MTYKQTLREALALPARSRRILLNDLIKSLEADKPRKKAKARAARK